MSSEKTEQPSAKRLREARRKGQIPRSRLLSSCVVTLGGLLGFAWGYAGMWDRLQSWTARLFLEQRLEGALEEGLGILVRLSAPVLGGAFLASLAVSIATVGFEVNPGHITPKWERVSVASGLKRIFSTKPWMEWVRALVAVTVVGVFVWREVDAMGADALRTALLAEDTGLWFMLERLGGLVYRVAWVLVVLGLADYALARRSHLRELMMSREELKREHKESEGDPRHKGQRRALHRQLAQGGPARGVQRATAVIVNPTHLAVALRYDTEECEAPYLVAKAREEDALRLREEARRLGIPVLRDVPLARSLIHYDVGEPIPEELYEAAAVVLRTAMDARDVGDVLRGQTS
ncbi:EscU/YscU/HrcU family type III secretion system export apparatus switch protein [Myxococcus stipitatus]|uniref:EscU/YscU/HrcU family type III secretion system export apparatus switch protein n=1 Tax=Myxococcus stipitatus TaxID=83455 RepID=UPI0030D46987